jgi:hypothetical protein
MLKLVLPIIIQAVVKVLADKEFRKLIWEIAAIELAWITGDKEADDALQEIWEMVQDYFVDGPDYKGIGVYKI